MPPDAIVIVNARIRTDDPRRPWADAVILRDDRIVFVGSSAEAMKQLPAGAVPLQAQGAELQADVASLRAWLDALPIDASGR